MLIRLQKHIADLGICSRRKAEELIVAGKVLINGKLVTELGTKVDPATDTVEVVTTKKKVHPPSAIPHPPHIYIVLNKPIGYITSTSNDQGESVVDLLIPENYNGVQKQKLTHRVYPVGRLDKDSEGLVLLTNDGELTNLLTHPRHEHEKEYEVTIDNTLTPQARKVLTTGMQLDDIFVQGIEIVKEFNKGRRTIITVILKEGKNRQIRKMFGRLGYTVLSLKRIQIGKLSLGVLPIGKWKFVKKEQII